MKKSTNFSHVCVRFDLITWLELLDVVDYFNEIIDIDKQSTIEKIKQPDKKLDILNEYVKHAYEWIALSNIDPLKHKQIKVNDIVKGLLDKSIYYSSTTCICSDASGCWTKNTYGDRYWKFDPKKEKYEQTDHGQSYLTIQKDILLPKGMYKKIKEICEKIHCPIAVYVRRQVRLFLSDMKKEDLYKKYIKRRKY